MIDVTCLIVDSNLAPLPWWKIFLAQRLVMSPLLFVMLISPVDFKKIWIKDLVREKLEDPTVGSSNFFISFSFSFFPTKSLLQI